MSNGKDDYWEAQNPDVWQALEPCLKLATWFLLNCHAVTWYHLSRRPLSPLTSFLRWNAFLFGTYSSLVNADSNNLLQFAPLPGRHSPSDFQTKFQQFLTLYDIHFILQSGWISNCAIRGKPHNPSSWGHGTTHRPWRDNVVFVCVGYEMLEPLMRDDHSPAERSVDMFRFAVTLIHELCVS